MFFSIETESKSFSCIGRLIDKTVLKIKHAWIIQILSGRYVVEKRVNKLNDIVSGCEQTERRAKEKNLKMSLSHMLASNN